MIFNKLPIEVKQVGIPADFEEGDDPNIVEIIAHCHIDDFRNIPNPLYKKSVLSVPPEAGEILEFGDYYLKKAEDCYEAGALISLESVKAETDCEALMHLIVMLDRALSSLTASVANKRKAEKDNGTRQRI